jgi:hypothetical protein
LQLPRAGLFSKRALPQPRPEFAPLPFQDGWRGVPQRLWRKKPKLGSMLFVN